MQKDFFITLGPNLGVSTHIMYFYLHREADGQCVPDPQVSKMVRKSVIPSKHELSVPVGHTLSSRMLEWIREEGLTSGHLRFYEIEPFSAEEIRMIEKLMKELNGFTWSKLPL